MRLPVTQAEAITLAAAALAHAFVLGPKGALALDRLTQTALDAARPDPLRVAALRALRDLDPATIAPLLKSLSTDRSEMVRAAVLNIPLAQSEGHPARYATVLDDHTSRGELPDGSPVGLCASAIAQAGSTAALPSLLQCAERVCGREQTSAYSPLPNWIGFERGTRLALDATLPEAGWLSTTSGSRSTIDRAVAGQVRYALAIAGDASCVRPFSGACARKRRLMVAGPPRRYVPGAGAETDPAPRRSRRAEKEVERQRPRPSASVAVMVVNALHRTTLPHAASSS